MTSRARGEYARLWRAADKVVYSTTLDTSPRRAPGSSRRSTPAAVEELKAASILDVSVGGPTLAAPRSGPVSSTTSTSSSTPCVVGGGTRALPDDVRVDLELVTVERIGEVVHPHHRVRR